MGQQQWGDLVEHSATDLVTKGLNLAAYCTNIKWGRSILLTKKHFIYKNKTENTFNSV